VLEKTPKAGPAKLGSRANRWISELIWLAAVLAAVTAARSSLADHYYIGSGSMEYSLMTNDRVVVDKTSYGFRIPLTTIDVFGSATPERGDIALFDSPEDGSTRLKATRKRWCLFWSTGPQVKSS
jgi:signal peptidase I